MSNGRSEGSSKSGLRPIARRKRRRSVGVGEATRSRFKNAPPGSSLSKTSQYSSRLRPSARWWIAR
jgi:hypothetical protein